MLVNFSNQVFFFLSTTARKCSFNVKTLILGKTCLYVFVVWNHAEVHTNITLHILCIHLIFMPFVLRVHWHILTSRCRNTCKHGDSVYFSINKHHAAKKLLVIFSVETMLLRISVSVVNKHIFNWLGRVEISWFSRKLTLVQ